MTSLSNLLQGHPNAPVIGVRAMGAAGAAASPPPSLEKIRAKRQKFGQNALNLGNIFDGVFLEKKIFFE